MWRIHATRGLHAACMNHATRAFLPPVKYMPPVAIAPPEDGVPPTLAANVSRPVRPSQAADTRIEQTRNDFKWCKPREVSLAMRGSFLPWRVQGNVHEAAGREMLEKLALRQPYSTPDSFPMLRHFSNAWWITEHSPVQLSPMHIPAPGSRQHQTPEPIPRTPRK